MSQDTPEPAANHEDARPVPVYRKNPAPKEAYRITMTLKDPPGPFAHVQGLAQFDVVNPECLPPPNANPGGHTSPVPTEGVEIPLHKTGENTWSGLVYADQMLDEDYYGEGVCRWQLIQAQVQMKATGAADDIKYVSTIQREEIPSQARVENLYLKDGYPRTNLGDVPYFGWRERSKFGANVVAEQLFSAVMQSSKEQ